MNTYTEYLKCDFTDAEISDRAKELAGANRRRSAIEQQKKEIDSDLKGQIEAENSKIQRLSEQIGMGYEYRNIACIVELDTPELGKKRIVREDTGEEVKVVAMTPEDKQASLNLQAEADCLEPIITPPPEVRQINGPVVEVLAEDGVNEHWSGRADDSPRATRRRRNPVAEAFADGSAE